MLNLLDTPYKLTDRVAGITRGGFPSSATLFLGSGQTSWLAVFLVGHLHFFSALYPAIPFSFQHIFSFSPFPATFNFYANSFGPTCGHCRSRYGGMKKRRTRHGYGNEKRRYRCDETTRRRRETRRNETRCHGVKRAGKGKRSAHVRQGRGEARQPVRDVTCSLLNHDLWIPHF